MNVLHERCGGLDIHKDTVVGCRRVMEGAAVRREARSFPTSTLGLLGLADWLREVGCTQVVDGSDRRVLEGGVACAGRGVRAGAGQCGTLRHTLKTSPDARAT